MRRLTAVLLGMALFVAAVIGPNPQVVTAQPTLCTVRDDVVDVLTAPAIFAPAVGELRDGDTVTADAQATSQGITWIEIDFDGDPGWIDAEAVTGCSLTGLPEVTPPGQAPVLSGFVPPLDQRGSTATAAIFLPPDVPIGADDVRFFTNSLDLLFDPSIRAFELGQTVQEAVFMVRDNEGNQVYRHTDSVAPYCLFAHATNGCETVWTFAQTGNFWPVPGELPLRASSQPIDPNTVYEINVEVIYTDGDGDNWRLNFRIIPPTVPPQDLYYVADSGSRSGSISLSAAELRVRRDTLVYAGGTPEFGERMVFELAVFEEMLEDDIAVGTVTFEIRDAESEEVVYRHTESRIPYCIFGDSQGAGYCDQVWRFAATNYIWPASDENSGVRAGIPVLLDHPYEATATATDTDGNFGGAWSFGFQIVQDAPPPAPQPSGLVVEAVQYAPESAAPVVADALAFQVLTYDPQAGSSDGAGIDQVVLALYDAAGTLLYQRTELGAPYCLFSNAPGADTCNRHDFSAAGYRWPAPAGQQGVPIQNGAYSVRVTVAAENGDVATLTFPFTIQVDDSSAPDAGSSELVATVAQIGPGSTLAIVTRALAFQLAVYDPQVGSTDGAGISRVDFALYDPTGDLVHTRTEQGAPYCLFSNAPGAGTCNSHVFSANGYRWPASNGQQGAAIQNGMYTVRATITTSGGDVAVATSTFVVQVIPD